jgi:hypothetical protein
MLTIEQIRDRHGPRQFTVDVPAWEGQVTFRRLTAADWIELANRNEADSHLDYLIRLIELTAVDADGGQLFTPADRYLLTDSPLIVRDLGVQVLEQNHVGSQKKSHSPTAHSNGLLSASA